MTQKPVKVEVKTLHLLPAAPDKCQECAVKHEPDQPHDKTSLYYQYYFSAKWGLWPTWEDAMAHCDEPTKKLWREELTKIGEKLNGGR